MEMIEYENIDEWKQFAESFVNNQNGIDDQNFENDTNLTDEEKKKIKKLINKTHVVG